MNHLKPRENNPSKKIEESDVKDGKPKLRELLSILKPYKNRAIFALIMSIIQVILFMQFPLMLQSMTGAVINNSMSQLINSFVWLVVVFSLNGIVLYFRWVYGSWFINNYIVYSVRNMLAEKILSHSYKFIDENQSGDLVSVMSKDVRMINNFLSFQLIYFIRLVLQGIGILVILYLICDELLLLLLIIFPFMILDVLIYHKKIHPITYQQRTIFGSLTHRLQENIAGVHMIRAFSNEIYEFEQFENINLKYSNSSRKVGKLSSLFNPIINFLVNIGRIIIVGAGGYFIMENVPGIDLEIDELIAFIPALELFLEPVMFTTWLLGEYGRIQAAYERIQNIMNSELDINEKPESVILPDIAGDVTFDNVSFGYRENLMVIHDLSFHVPAGSTVALLGATGSGKSTIINLLMRFYDISQGSIRIDNKWDIRDINLDSFRKQIGIVAQEPFLFQQTIYENLTHGLTSVSKEDVINACKIADIHDFIMSRKNGYYSIVGERGVTVSGGQKQRLTLARALLRDPKILILDDATSSVDVDTEYEILIKLKEIFHKCTTFIITQRLSTVRNADFIYVFDNGRIIEQGTHLELMDLNQNYAKLYNTVTRGD